MKQILFIGLGGCGLKTISQLSKKLSAQGDPAAEYHFLYIDTDEETRAKINKYETLIPLSQFVNVGDTNPYKVYNHATKGSSPRDIRMLEWAISQEPGHLTFPNQPLSDGAQADRMVGRTALVQYHQAFYDAIEKELNAFAEFAKNSGEIVEPDIWVVSSCCGGTGSSISIDTLYLIDRVAGQKGLHASVKLVLYMPKPFIDVNVGLHNYPLNGFAYMWELNALEQGILDTKPDIFKHFSAYPWDIKFEGDDHYNLFKMVIPVDVETDRSTKIPLDNLYPTTAEMMYYLVVGNGASDIEGMLSNSLRESRRQTAKLDKYKDTDFKWGTWMVPYGYRVIRKADKELRDYMKKRATLEVLRYGLLGERIANDDDVKEAAKKAFAAEYILPLLCEVDNAAIGEESVQGDLDEAFKSLRLPIDGLDAQRINGFINNVSRNIENPSELRKKYYDAVCASINKGINKTVANKGVQYTAELLDLVDNYYLEKLYNGALKNMQVEAEEEAETLLGKLRSFASQGINKKNASAAADTGKKYAEACKLAITYKVVRDIIKSLTEQNEGYLEIIRNGGNDHVGLYELVNIINVKVMEAQKDWNLLSKTFRETKNDALTIYLPSLYEIAGGDEGNGWKEGSLFEELYYESILPYDKEIAKGVNGRKVPARQTEGSTKGINSYLGQLISRNGLDVFVKLALSSPKVARTELDTLISKQLSQVLDDAINASGTPASNWLAQTLEEFVTLNADNLNLDMLTNPTLIPVLYPTKVAHTQPVSTSLLYIGAKKSLAQAFGYRDNVNNTQFVADEGMTDRFQIIKMPVGMDFYSYKYFDMLQSKYYAARESILAQAEGCHLHKAFRFLDLDKALESIKTPETIDAMRLFLKGLFLQKVVDVLKEKEPAAYQELMGVYDAISGFSMPDTNEGGEIDLLASVGLGGPSGSPIDLGTTTVHDCFFRESIVKGERTLSLKVITSPCMLDTANHLVVDAGTVEFLLPDVTTPQALTDALKSASKSGQTLLDQLQKIAVVETALATSAVKDAFHRVKEDALKRVLTPGPDSQPTFVHLLRSWLKRNLPEHEIYLNEIRQFFNSVIR